MLAFVVVWVLHWYEFNVYVRTTLAPCIVISATAFFGIVHPPAGASAVAFAAKDQLHLRYSLIFFIEISITIVVAVLVNNFSDKRQYPTAWPILQSVVRYLRPYFELVSDYLSFYWNAVYAIICPSKLEKPKVLTPGEIFQRIDTNSNGLLSRSEIAEAIQMLADNGELELNENSPLELATKFISNADANHDGYVDKEEFEASLLAFSTEVKNIEAARNAFQVIDVNGDGVLDREEVAKAIEMLVSDGLMSEEQLNGMTPLQMSESMIQECDEDGNGELDMDEFAHMIKNFF